jgi:hypothetical protein
MCFQWLRESHNLSLVYGEKLRMPFLLSTILKKHHEELARVRLRLQVRRQDPRRRSIEERSVTGPIQRAARARGDCSMKNNPVKTILTDIERIREFTLRETCKSKLAAKLQN